MVRLRHLLVPLALAPGCTCERSPSGAGAAPSGAAGGTHSFAPRGGALVEADCLSKIGREGDTIRSCVLARDKTLGEVPCQARGFLQLAPNGGVERCRLGEPRVWATIPCGVGRTASFYPSGALRSCVVPDAWEVGGVACKWQIELHEDGKLQRCRLAKPTALAGRELPEHVYLTFDRAGALERIEFPSASPEAFGSLACVHLHLWPSGKVKGCGIGPATSLGGESIPAGSLVCFDEQGERDDSVDARCGGRAGAGPAATEQPLAPPP